MSDSKVTELFYNGKTLKVPTEILENIDLLFDSKATQEITEDLMDKYFKSNNLSVEGQLDSSILNQVTKFFSPSEIFKMQWKKGVFTPDYKKKLLQHHYNSVESMIQTLSKTAAKIKDNIEEYDFILREASQVHSTYLTSDSANEKKEEVEDLDQAPQRVLTMTTEQLEFYGCESGYTTISSEESLGDEEISESNKFLPSMTYTSNVKNEISYLEKIDKQEKLDKSIPKTVKNQVTIKSRSEEERHFFKLQEIERYKHPHLPWIYYSLDGTQKYIVCPIQKKPPTSSSSKPREHVMLKKDRPGNITILCLARDAASRLENFVGTRADICELIKDSFYINERITDNQINTIVSGALDRLHYEKDPCVKYDVQKKLWIYLHGQRTIEYPRMCIINYYD